MSDMTDAELQALFAELDNRHFDGRLATAGWRVIAGAIPFPAHLLDYPCGWCIPFHRQIIVDKHGEHPDGVRATLLHEMAHAKVEQPEEKRVVGHGRRWARELCRLYYAGERCLENQVKGKRPRIKPLL
jgi:hypothetical protein